MARSLVNEQVIAPVDCLDCSVQEIGEPWFVCMAVKHILLGGASSRASSLVQLSNRRARGEACLLAGKQYQCNAVIAESMQFVGNCNSSFTASVQ